MSILDWLRGKKKRAHSTLTAEQVDRLASDHNIDALLPGLRSPDLFVRGRVVIKLGALKDARAVDALVDVLRTDDDWGIRENVVKALATLKDTKAVDPLIAALRDPHKDVRMNAVLALGGIGDKRAIAPLEDLGRRDSYVTREVEWAVKELRAK